MRPINNIVDATNYVMLEVGEPLHAFDYEALVRRAAERPRTPCADRGERYRRRRRAHPDDFTVLVCDEAGPLSIAGVMGGAETEVGPATRTILLEGAAWNLIKLRRTTAAQHLTSEASYRFSRGVHPALAERGVRRGLDLMQRLAGGRVASGLVDVYPRPAVDSTVDLSAEDIERAQSLTWRSGRYPSPLEFEKDGAHCESTALPIDIGWPGRVGLSKIARFTGTTNRNALADTLLPSAATACRRWKENCVITGRPRPAGSHHVSATTRARRTDG
jgi:hypothetical protein